MASFISGDKLATIKVKLGVSSAWRQVCGNNLERCQPDSEAIALIDTGATVSIVDNAIIDRLCISSKGTKKVRGFCGPTLEYQAFDVSLKAINKHGNEIITEPDHLVIGADLNHDKYSIILGMDLLHSFTLKFLYSDGIADMEKTEN